MFVNKHQLFHVRRDIGGACSLTSLTDTVASRTLLKVYLCRAIVAVVMSENRTIAAVSPGGHAVISTVSVSSSTFILQLHGRVSAVCAEN